MTHVATLVTAPASAILSEVVVARVVAALPGATTPVWLAPNTAADIFFIPPPGADDTYWAQLARAALDHAPIDVVVQPLRGRRKHLLVADMDSTVIEQECIDELAEAVGLRAEVSALTARSMRGEVDFDQSLRERVALLRGLDVARAIQIVTDRMTLMPGAGTLVRTMRAHGAIVVLASGGFTLFTAHVADRLGFDRHYGNIADIEGGRLTGTLQAPIFGRAAKRTVLQRLRDQHALAPEDTMAVGDGANDLAMLEEAGLGVAYRAKPAVVAVARARIEHGDLTGLLFIQGFSQKDFLS